MKKCLKILAIALALMLFFSMPSYTQDNKNIGKSFYTPEEVKKMCCPRFDTAMIAKLRSMHKESISNTNTSESKLLKTETIPNWRPFMSPVEYQGLVPDCWAHAATGIVEGQIQIMKDSILGNNGINLDEFELDPDSVKGVPGEALTFILYNKVRSDTLPYSSYPNLKGVRWGITGINNVVTLGDNKGNIDIIKAALQKWTCNSRFL